MVSAAGFEPTAPGFMPLRLSPPRPPEIPPGRSWSGLSLRPRLMKARRRRPSSLYTFPVAGAWLGIGKAHERPSFPRLWAVPLRRFRAQRPIKPTRNPVLYPAELRGRFLSRIL